MGKICPDTLSLTPEGVPEMVWEEYFMRILGAYFGFCGYQSKCVLMPWLAMQLMVALSPRVIERRAEDHVSTMLPLEGGTTYEN